MKDALEILECVCSCVTVQKLSLEVVPHLSLLPFAHGHALNKSTLGEDFIFPPQMNLI